MDSIPDLATQLLTDTEFVSDMARYAEGILTEKFIRRKYGNLTDDVWAALGDNDELISAIEAEKALRVRNGSAKREKAQQHIVKAPDILNTIMNDESANPRHRVDSIKALDSLADPSGSRATPAADRFVINIDLGEDYKLTIDKERGLLTPEEAKKRLDDDRIIEGTAITDQSKDDWKE